MPLYFFHLRGDRRIADPIGTELPDESAAHAHACRVARELMRGREPSTRTWRLDVFDRNGDFCFGLLFASVDDSIARWAPDTRSNLESFLSQQGILHRRGRSGPRLHASTQKYTGGATPQRGQQPRHCSGRPLIDHSIDERDRLPDGARFLLIDLALRPRFRQAPFSSRCPCFATAKALGRRELSGRGDETS